MKTSSIIRLNAGNDRNGNPRRLFLGITKLGDVSGAWDEGYAGRHAMPEDVRGLWSGLTILTTPGEYRAILKQFAK